MSISLALTGQEAKVEGDSWEVFRGNPAQNGVSNQEMRGPLKIQWKVLAKDAIESTAGVFRGKVYFGSLDENLYCLDAKTGQTVWVKKCGPIKAPVAINHSTVYAGDINGLFHCCDATNGNPKWTFQTQGEISGGACFFNKLLLFGSQDEHLYCLDEAGKEKWKFRMDGPFFGSCAIQEGKTFAAGCDSTLHVLDVLTGKEIHALDLGGQTGATASLSGDSLYVGTMSNQVLGINWKKPSVQWTYEPAKRAQPFFSSCAIAHGLVVVGGRDKKIHAINQATGLVKWEFTTEGKVDGSPLILGNKVLAGSFDGNLYVLELATGKLTQKLDLGGELAASPVFAGNSIYIGNTKGVFYCLRAE